MARHYSTKDFFRQMPIALLARYFRANGVLGDQDFSALKDGKPDALFAAWLLLSDSSRNAMDAEFRDIHELSCEKGFRAILDEAKWQLKESPDALNNLVETHSALPNHYERAMITFLDHNEFWKGATRFYHADTLPYWRKRKNLPHQPAAVDNASLQELAGLIRSYFHNAEGRGNNCVVEPFRRGELDYFFAYPEDFSQQSVEWVDGQFGRRPHNPAFEVIYVYSKMDGTLDLNYRGARKAVEPLQVMFATAILKLDELPPDPNDERVYDLNPLCQRDFNFTYAVGSGIQSVAVKKLRLSSRVKRGDRITLEADTMRAPEAFVVCDKRSDINRVAVPVSRLEQWLASGASIANLLAGLLGLRRPRASGADSTRWEIGMLKGAKLSSHLVLLADGRLSLALAGHSMAFADVLGLEGDRFTVDKRTLKHLVDQPVAGAGDRESAAQRRERFKKRKQELKAKGDRTFLKTISEEEAISVSRVKQLLRD